MHDDTQEYDAAAAMGSWLSLQSDGSNEAGSAVPPAGLLEMPPQAEVPQTEQALEQGSKEMPPQAEMPHQSEQALEPGSKEMPPETEVPHSDPDFDAGSADPGAQVPEQAPDFDEADGPEADHTYIW